MQRRNLLPPGQSWNLSLQYIIWNALGLLISICLCYIAQYLHTDYGFYGVAIILLFYMFNDNKIALSISFILATVIKYSKEIHTICSYSNLLSENGYDVSVLINRNIIACVCTAIPLIFICLYNGKKGRNTKHLLYLFYPIHLFLIYLITLL